VVQLPLINYDQAVRVSTDRHDCATSTPPDDVKLFLLGA
jgi:hypothetical protein